MNAFQFISVIYHDLKSLPKILEKEQAFSKAAAEIKFDTRVGELDYCHVMFDVIIYLQLFYVMLGSIPRLVTDYCSGQAYIYLYNGKSSKQLNDMLNSTLSQQCC